MRGRGCSAALVAVCVVTGATVARAESVPVISAHRASVSGFAENSVAGFTAAAAEGVTDLEGDVFATRDGVLVLSHDSPLPDSTCEGPYLGIPLRDLDVAQVEEMTCEGAPIAPLSEVIDALAAYPATTLRIEIKHGSGDTEAERTSDAVLLARQLAGSGMTARSILQDFDWAITTSAIRAASPGQRVSALSTSISTTRIKAASAAGAYDFSYAVGRSTAFWNRYVAAKGLRSAVWTVDDPQRARAVRAENVGTVITNVPQTVRDAYAAAGSGCTLTPYSRTTALRGWVTPLPAGGRLYLELPVTAPDGHVVETTKVQVNARTSSGTATLRVGPQGTPYSTTWEKSVGVTSTRRSTVVEVAAGNANGMRLRNISSRTVSVTVSAIGGSVYVCPWPPRGAALGPEQPRLTWTRE